MSKERPPSSSESKVSSSKLEPSVVIELDHSLNNTRKESSLSSTRSLSVSKNRSRSPPESVQMSISCAPSGSTDKKIVRMPQNGAKSAVKADKKKRSCPSSVHMSLNFASSARHTTKAASKTLVRNFTTQETTSSNARNKVFPKTNEPTGASISRKRPLSQTSKEGSKAAKCSTSVILFSSFSHCVYRIFAETDSYIYCRPLLSRYPNFLLSVSSYQKTKGY